MTSMRATSAVLGALTSRLLLVTLVVLSVVAANLTILAPRASADVNDKITITLDSFLAYSDQSGTSNNPIRKNEVAQLAFTWDATNANVQPGDSFEIGLPPVFKNRRAITQPLIDKGQNIGECVITERKIACTFNDNVRGRTVTTGSATAEMLAIEETLVAEVPFTINATSTAIIATPGGKPIGPAHVGSYKRQDLGKSITPFAETTSELVWSMTFGHDVITKVGGAEPNGTTPLTLKINDKVSFGSFFDPARPYFELVRATSAAEPVRPNLRVTDTRGVDKADNLGEFTVTAEPITERETNFIITGPFEADTNYVLVYKAYPKSDNGRVKPGVEYANTAQAQGIDKIAKFARTYTDSFSVSVQMHDNFGSFKIAKNLAGERAAFIGQEQDFTASVRYELPFGRTSNDYPTWNTVPQTNPFTVTFKPGKFTQHMGQFPVGTKLYISEPTQPSIANIEWGAPEYSVSGRAKVKGEAVVTIENQKSTQVVVTNTANPAMGKFKISKTLKDIPDSVAFANKNFTFSYVCDSGPHGDITVEAGGAVVESPEVPLGDTCHVTENAPTNTPAGWEVRTESTKDVVVTADDSDLVAFVNTYTRQMGSFKVKKVVEGANLPADASFTFGYECPGIQPGEITATADGTPADGPQIPVGTECRVTEKNPNNTPANLNLQQPEAQTVTIATGEPQVLTFTNSYTPKTGTLILKKAVNGDYTPVDNDRFTVSYVCEGNIQGQRHLAANGTAEQVTGIPVGTKCTIAEPAAEAQRDTYTLATTFSADGDAAAEGAQVTIVEGNNPELVVTNTYTKKKASLGVKKVVEGAYTPAAADRYTVSYTCGALTGDLELVPNGDAQLITDIPVGTTCTIAEKPEGTARDTFTLATTYAPDADAAIGGAQVTVVEGLNPAVVVTNAYTKKNGSFSVKKAVTGVTLDPETAFTFEYDCAGTKGEITAKADGTPVKGGDFPVGTSCTVTEKAPVNTPANYNWTAPAPQTVKIVEGEPTVLTFTNVYDHKKATFSVKKAVEGDYKPVATDAYTVTYTCGELTGDISLDPNGEAKTSPEIPVGTTCTIAEKAEGADRANFTLATTYTGDADDAKAGAQVAIAEGTTPQVVVTNTYTLKTGSFTVKKTVEGVKDAAALEGKKFTFAYECSNDTKGTLDVAAGATMNGPVLPHGTTCTVTEDAKSAELAGLALTAPAAQDVTVQADETEGLEFTNSYKPITTTVPGQPTPGTPGTPGANGPQSGTTKQKGTTSTKAPSKGGKAAGKSSLAQTGANGVLGGMAALSLATGAMMLIARRRRDD